MLIKKQLKLIRDRRVAVPLNFEKAVPKDKAIIPSERPNDLEDSAYLQINDIERVSRTSESIIGNRQEKEKGTFSTGKD